MVRYLVMEANHGMNGGLCFNGLGEMVSQSSLENGARREIIRRLAEFAPACVAKFGDGDAGSVGASQVADDHDVIKKFDNWLRQVRAQLSEAEQGE